MKPKEMELISKCSGFEFSIYTLTDEVQSPLCALSRSRYEACAAETASLVSLDKGLNHPSSAGNNKSLPCNC